MGSAKDSRWHSAAANCAARFNLMSEPLVARMPERLPLPCIMSTHTASLLGHAAATPCIAARRQRRRGDDVCRARRRAHSRCPPTHAQRGMLTRPTIAVKLSLVRGLWMSSVIDVNAAGALLPFTRAAHVCASPTATSPLAVVGPAPCRAVRPPWGQLPAPVDRRPSRPREARTKSCSAAASVVFTTCFRVSEL